MSRPERTVPVIARRLEATRIALGLTQRAFALQAGVQPTAYNNWKKGIGRPDIDQAIRLADAYGLTLDWIYLGDASGLPLRIASKIAAPMLTPK